MDNIGATRRSRDGIITPSQMRDARLALGWSRERLAGASNTTPNFIKIYEEEGRIARINLRQFIFDGLNSVRATLAEYGISFVDEADGSVRLRDPAGSDATEKSVEPSGKNFDGYM